MTYTHQHNYGTQDIRSSTWNIHSSILEAETFGLDRKQNYTRKKKQPKQQRILTLRWFPLVKDVQYLFTAFWKNK